MNILGISCDFHDSASALLVDGMLVAAAEEERFSRKKHDSDIPKMALQFCLHRAGLTAKDLDYVVFYEKPLLKFERIIQTSLCTFPRSCSTFSASMINWLQEKLWIKSRLQAAIGVPAHKILFVEHHLAHAASSMFCSPFSEAAVVTVDGVGEWTTTSIGGATARWGDNGVNQIKLTEHLSFPHSLGLLYSAFTAYLGFKVNSGEYKVMGMAPYGAPLHMDEIEKIVCVDENGGLRLNLDFFAFHRSSKKSFSDKFVALFGPPRNPESDFFTLGTHPQKNHENWDDNAAIQNQRYADIAASIQHFTEEVLIKIARFAQQQTGSKNLVLAGGVGLNSAANGRLLRESNFENIYIQPAAGDAGGALGAALYFHHVILGKPRKFVMEHAYWGAEYSQENMFQALSTCGFKFEEFSNEQKRTEQMVDALTKGAVIGLFNDRFEWGPRSLGNRSIIADPRKESMKEIVNTKIKFRESFRPFAPSVIEDRVADYFQVPGANGEYLRRFMLSVSNVRDEKKNEIPAVNHKGTSRIQAVTRKWNRQYFDLIDTFGQATGTPLLLNTSFNLRGEPIVSSPQDAINSFANSEIDLLAMGPFIIWKPEGYSHPKRNIKFDDLD